MLKIRLQRTGRKNQAHFKIVLAEHTAPPKSKAIEILGYYNPRKKEKSFKEERIKYWLSQGAKPTDTVFNLLFDAHLVEGKKIVKKSISKRKREELKKLEEEKRQEELKKKEEAKAESEQKAENSEAQENKVESEKDESNQDSKDKKE